MIGRGLICFPLLKGGGEKKRASSAAMKPKAEGVAPLSGTNSCKAPQTSPPCGRQRSMAERPKGIALAS